MGIKSIKRLKDLLDFTCMIADKFSKDAKVKLILFQKKNRAKNVSASTPSSVFDKTDDGVDDETFFARFFFWNKINFTFASFENLSIKSIHTYLTGRKDPVEDCC